MAFLIIGIIIGAPLGVIGYFKLMDGANNSVRTKK